MTSPDCILIVEDEPADAEFLQRAFGKAGATCPVRAVSNGEEAVGYLSGHGAFADRQAHPLPRFIVTDLKMPQMDGLQFLRWLKSKPEVRVVPAVVFTSSTSQSDIDTAFECGASGYIVKPVEFKQLERIARTMLDYWQLSQRPTLRP